MAVMTSKQEKVKAVPQTAHCGHQGFKGTKLCRDGRIPEDSVIKSFLGWDMNLRASDKYLLAMVITYFSLAGFFSWQYQRIHFFLALYLAIDMEEDDQIPKLAILLFLYNWNLKLVPQFHKLRHQFICCMDWNLRVTREECEEIQAYDPALWVWSRDRALIPGPWYPENSALLKVGGRPGVQTAPLVSM
ncbi:speedy protein E4-like [Cavia porcellus]|uniref:speedy protein E4-like n=1 Tax=Cavia porcellus TaxID=10141 RepID=UPI002FE1AF1B